MYVSELFGSLNEPKTYRRICDANGMQIRYQPLIT